MSGVGACGVAGDSLSNFNFLSSSSNFFMASALSDLILTFSSSFSELAGASAGAVQPSTTWSAHFVGKVPGHAALCVVYWHLVGQ